MSAISRSGRPLNEHQLFVRSYIEQHGGLLGRSKEEVHARMREANAAWKAHQFSRGILVKERAKREHLSGTWRNIIRKANEERSRVIAHEVDRALARGEHFGHIRNTAAFMKEEEKYRRLQEAARKRSERAYSAAERRHLNKNIAANEVGFEPLTPYIRKGPRVKLTEKEKKARAKERARIRRAEKRAAHRAAAAMPVFRPHTAAYEPI